MAEASRKLHLYETILGSTPDLVYVFDLDHRFIYANPALLAMWGRTWDESIGKNCLELGYEPWHAAMHDREIEQVIAARAPIRGVVPFNGANGRRIYDYIFTPVIGQDGAVEAVAGTTRDVTERITSEEALKQSESRYRSLFGSMDEGFCIVQMLYGADDRPVDCRFVETNLAFERHSGLVGVVGDTLRQVAPHLEPEWLERFKHVAESGEASRFVHRVNSIGKWFDVNAYRTGEPGEGKVAVLFSDVSAQKRREESLLLLNEVDRQLAHLASADDMMLIVGERLCAHLGLAGCNFCLVDEAADEITTDLGWNYQLVPNRVRKYRLSEYFQPAVVAAGRSGETVTVGDTQRDPRVAAKGYAELGIGSFIMIPFHRDARWVSLFGAVSHEPRAWRDDEIELCKEFATRLFGRLDQARAEKALRESEARFRAAIEAIGILWTNDAGGQMRGEQPGWSALTGQTLAEYEGYGWAAAVHPDDAQPTIAAWEVAVRERRTFEFEHRVRCRDGNWRLFAIRAVPVLGADGEVREWVGVHVDVTDARESRAALEDQLRIVQTIAENADSPLMLLDRNGFTTYANPAFFRITGYEVEDTRGKTAHELIHYRYPDGSPFPIDECPIDNAYWNLEAARNLELTFVRKDGSLFPVVAHVAPLKGETGEMQGGVLEFRDVSDEKAREKALRFLVNFEEATRAEEDPVAIMSLTTQLLAEHLDVDRCAYAFVDEAEADFTIHGDYFRNGMDSMVGTHPIAAFGERILKGHRAGETFILRDVESELRGESEYEAFRRSGIAAAISVPIKKRDRLVAIMGIHSRVPRPWTPEEVNLVEMVANRCWAHIEQARATKALWESADQYRQIAEGLPQMVWSAKADGIRDYFNRRWIEFTGIGRDEAENPWLAVLHPDDRERASNAWSTAVAGGDVFQAEYRLRSRDGRYRWFLGRSIPLRGDEGQVVRWFGTCTDIHDQKATQNLLQVSNEFAQTLAQDLDLGRIVQSLTDATTSAIGAEFGSFFYTVTDEAGGAFLLYTLSGAPIEAFSKLGLPRATAVFGPTFRGEGIIRSSDIREDPRYGKMGGPHHGMPAGHLPVVSYLAVPVASRSGEVIGGLFFGHSMPNVFTEEHERIVASFAAQASVAIDNARLYDQVRAAKEELEERVQERTADLLSAKERLEGFTYHVAHDLRAPLRAIGGTSRILQEDFGSSLPDAAHGLLDRQVQAANRLGQLVDDLLKASRLSRQEMLCQPVDITFLARDAATEALSIHPYSSVQVDVEEGLQAEGDPRLIRLALLNLIENAVKYSPDGGRVQVGKTGEGIFFVADEGIGMDPRFVHKIFEPFQRLHLNDKFGGTGIGLANVRQVIERHGGQIWVETIPERGSTFHFVLPELGMEK